MLLCKFAPPEWSTFKPQDLKLSLIMTNTLAYYAQVYKIICQAF